MKKKAKYNDMASADKARAVAGWLRDQKGGDVMAIDVAGLCPISEVMVLATATSTRHAKGLAAHVLDEAGRENIEMLGIEGHKEGQWVLVDLNDVMVHIFTRDNRELYDLEGLWSEGSVLVGPAEDGDDA